MDTTPANSRRFSRFGSSPAVGRVAGDRTTEIAPSEAVAAPGSATHSGGRASAHLAYERDKEREGNGRRAAEEHRTTLAAQTQQVLLTASDGPPGTAWPLPGAVLSDLYRQTLAETGPHDPPASTGNTEDGPRTAESDTPPGDSEIPAEADTAPRPLRRTV